MSMNVHSAETPAAGIMSGARNPGLEFGARLPNRAGLTKKGAARNRDVPAPDLRISRDTKDAREE